jgi:hypothetical protein
MSGTKPFRQSATRAASPLRLLLAAAGFLLLLPGTAPAQVATNSVYSDQLDNGWQNWSWATVNFANTSPVHSGTDSIQVTTAPYTALYLHNGSIPGGPYANITFWINGGSAGGQLLVAQAVTNQIAVPLSVNLDPLPTNSWLLVTVSLQALGVAGNPDFDGFWIQDRSGLTQPPFYMDDVALAGSSGGPVTNAPQTTNAPIVVRVDAAALQHPISDWIYGTAFATASQAADLDIPVNRSGGNSETRYNWQINAHNLAADWYFESITASDPNPGVAGDYADQFVSDSLQAGSQPLLTVPMIGWTPKLGANRSILPSYSIAKYGAQTGYDPYDQDAGNGILSSGGVSITNNDPNDANVPATVAFQQSWLSHLTNKWGTASSGGVPLYLLDNEPSIWFSTHRDVHPVGAGMDEIFQKSTNYAAMIKSVDPSAKVAGPEEWGWSGYFYSGLDQQYGAANGYSSLPDRAAHQNSDYIPWLLQQFQKTDAATGHRLLDYLTVHFYPQGGEGNNDTTTATQLLRNRSTRSLWDTNYVDQSWINAVVQLIPRLHSWVNTYYPGTKIGITEYNWGVDDNINGATAQADILGIFGRDGLDLGSRWTAPATSTPAYNAIKMYRNYDGKKSVFGNTSISTQTPNPDNLSAFGAVRSSDGSLTVMVVSKQLSGLTPTTVNLTNYAGLTSQVWRLDVSNIIYRLPDIALSGGAITDTLPPQSITLYVITTSQAPRLAALGWLPDGNFGLQLIGSPGQTYRIQDSTNLIAWQNWQTAILAANSTNFEFTPGPSTPMFFRAATP